MPERPKVQKPKAFSEPDDRAVFTCRHVLGEGRPILSVSHDPDGDWQFLCGGDHEDSDAAVVSLAAIVSRDPSLVTLADMPICREASRDAPEAPWRIADPHEQPILDHIARYGWHAALVPAGEDAPPFAYSIGFYHSYRHPEVLIIGAGPELGHSMLRGCAQWREANGPIPLDRHIPGLIEGFDCVFKEIPRRRYRDFFGYALWYYKGDDFPALQCVMPDKQGRFPWQPGFDERYRRAQPVLYDEP
jgi:hypothetical protein